MFKQLNKRHINVLHFADIQYKVRGQHLNKKVEYEYVNKQLVDIIRDKNIDLVLFAGDGFEFWQTNNVEEGLWISLVNDMFAVNPNLVFISTDGNHDIKQNFNTFDKGDGSFEYHPSTLSKLAKALTKAYPSYVHYDCTGVYELSDKLIAAVWDHNSKYRKSDNTADMFYSPWQLAEHVGGPDASATLDGSFCIELFHDPVKDCVSFDGNTVHGNNDDRVPTGAFKGQYVALGDIHKPQLFDLGKGRIAVYPGSTAIHDFGEGDYYRNGRLYRAGNTEHGVNIFTIDTETLTYDNLEWVAIKQLVHLHTIKVDNDLAGADITGKLVNAAPINKVIFENNVTQPGLTSIVDAYINNIAANNQIASFDVTYNMSAVVGLSSVDALNADNVIEQILDKGWLTNTANEWCDKWAAANPQITDDIRDAFKSQFTALFTKELNKLDIRLNKSVYAIHSVWANQFMALTDVSINIDSLGDLVRINGNNGNGKTTFFRLIKWLQSGFIDSNQSSAASKQNNIAYFNDKLDNDVLDGGMIFSVNDGHEIVKYKLERSLLRHWKRGCKDMTKTDWWQNITKIDESVKLTRLSDDYVFETPSEIDAILYNAFGSIWELARYVCIDQSSLDAIMQKSPNDFMDWLLDQLGIDVFVKLSNSYDTARTEAFANLSKPSTPIDLLIANVEENNERLTAEEVNLQACQKNCKEQQELLKTERDAIETLSKKLHQIPDNIRNIDDVKADGVKATAELKELSTKQSVLPSEVDTKLTTAVADAKNAIDTLELSATNAKNAKLKEAEPLNKQIIDNNATAALIEKQYSEHRQKLYTDWLFVKTNNDNDVRALKERQYNAVIAHGNEVLYKQRLQQSELQKSIADITKQIADIDIADAANVIQYNNLKQKIDNLSNGICDECHSKLDNADTTAYVTALGQQFAAIETTLKTSAANRTSAVNTLNATKQQYDSIKLLEVANVADIIATFDEEQVKFYNEALLAIATAEAAAFKHAELGEQIKTMPNKEFDDKLLQLKNDNLKLQEQSDAITAAADKLYNDMLLNKNVLVENHAKATTAADEHQKLVKLYNEYAKQIVDKQSAVDALTREYNDVEKYIKQQQENEQTQQVIATHKSTEFTLNAEVAKLLQDIAKYQTNIALIEADLSKLNAEIDAAKQWRLTEYVVDCYRNAISKKGIIATIFTLLAVNLNDELQRLLSKMSFRIFFDINDGNTLKMLDLVGSHTVRKIAQMSGMQTTFAALSIVFLIVSKRYNKIGNILMIDEISGKLNDGATSAQLNDVNTTNYQALLAKLLRQLSNGRKVFIVDHVMDYDNFDILNIIRKDDGTSTILTLSNRN